MSNNWCIFGGMCEQITGFFLRDEFIMKRYSNTILNNSKEKRNKVA